MDLNHQHPPYQGGALPIELWRLLVDPPGLEPGDPLHHKQMLYRLSYDHHIKKVGGTDGI